jgi:hypothetical protein
VNPLRQPRLWARLAATTTILIAAWALLVPITAVYVTSDADPAPRDVSSMYSWWTSEQDLVFSDASGVDLLHLDQSYFDQDHLANGIRLGCGNVFTAGPHEQLEAPDGPLVCSGLETPRRIIGLSLLVLGVFGLLAAVKLPPGTERYRSQYRQPYSQRRLLKRGR